MRAGYKYIEDASPGQVQVPPVMIIVCDNVDIAEVFYRNISGEEQIEVATVEDAPAISRKRPVNPVYYPACGVAMMPPSKRRPSWHAVRGGIQTKNRSGA
ncbi:MAG: hypothetical protein ACKVS9_12855, partial [Phycisphaerae bacterium]